MLPMGSTVDGHKQSRSDMMAKWAREPPLDRVQHFLVQADQLLDGIELFTTRYLGQFHGANMVHMDIGAVLRHGNPYKRNALIKCVAVMAAGCGLGR